MDLYFPSKSLKDFKVENTSLEGNPVLLWNLPSEIYAIDDEKNPLWRYVQFRLIPDVLRNNGHLSFVGTQRKEAKDFSCLVVGVWTGVYPLDLQVALFYQAYNSYRVFKSRRIDLEMANSLGEAVAESYVIRRCPENLERLHYYVNRS